MEEDEEKDFKFAEGTVFEENFDKEGGDDEEDNDNGIQFSNLMA